jgi:hypothetical protein
LIIITTCCVEEGTAAGVVEVGIVKEVIGEVVEVGTARGGITGVEVEACRDCAGCANCGR